MPRIPDPQPSETRTRRRLALCLVALALAPVGLLTACGNAADKQRNDNRPEPNASTEGVRSVYPTTAPPVTEAPTVVPRSGPPSPELSPNP